MTLSAWTCNLWTQALHANCIQTLAARPETNDAFRFAPIGVALGLAEEDGVGAGLKISVPTQPVGGRDHYDEIDTRVAQPALNGANKLQHSATMGLKVHDQQIGPDSLGVAQQCRKRRPSAIGVAQMDGIGEVSIGLPLDGWDLAVVDGEGQPVTYGESGELVIGGVGLARYLDPAKDAEKYAPMETLGWERAYRSGDVVRLEEDGLYFNGRVDDQVKIGGRRLELGEVDTAVSALPGVSAGAAAVKKTDAGQAVLVAYLTFTVGLGCWFGLRRRDSNEF